MEILRSVLSSWPLLSSGSVLLLFSGRTLAVESPQFSAGENFIFLSSKMPCKAYCQGATIPWDHFLEKGKCIYIKNTPTKTPAKRSSCFSYKCGGESHSVFREVDLFGHAQYLRPPTITSQGGLTSIIKLVPGME